MDAANAFSALNLLSIGDATKVVFEGSAGTSPFGAACCIGCGEACIAADLLTLPFSGAAIRRVTASAPLPPPIKDENRAFCSKHLSADRKRASFVIEYIEGSAVEGRLEGQKQDLSQKALCEYYQVEASRPIQSGAIERVATRTKTVVSGFGAEPSLILDDLGW